MKILKENKNRIIILLLLITLGIVIKIYKNKNEELRKDIYDPKYNNAEEVK